jgi:hypothetical protein
MGIYNKCIGPKLDVATKDSSFKAVKVNVRNMNKTRMFLLHYSVLCSMGVRETYLEQCCRVHAEAVRSRLSDQGQGLRVVYSQQSPEPHVTKRPGLGLWLGLILEEERETLVNTVPTLVKVFRICMCIYPVLDPCLHPTLHAIPQILHYF